MASILDTLIPQQQQDIPHLNDPPSVDELAVNAPPRANPMDQILMQAPSTDPGPLQSGTPNPQMDGPPDPGVPQTQTPPRMNYNNTGAVRAVGNALQDEGTPSGGSANPGVYGLLPQKLQHGTLRNILGALGDAFLQGGGGNAVYRPRMEQQAIGQAMAGMDINDPQSVAAAVQRVAGTGSPGSAEMADKIQQQAVQAQMRREALAQTGIWRQQQIDAKNDGMYNRMYAAATGDLGRATSAADYATRLARWDARVKAIDPKADAISALGVPAEYDPGQVNAAMGTTSNQQQQSSDRRRGQDMTQQNSQGRDNAILRSAGASASSRIGAANISANRPDEATFQDSYIQRRRAGQSTTPEEDARFLHDTHVSNSSRRRPPASVAINPPPSGAPVVTNGDVAYLRSNDTPQNRARFEHHFGAGAARKYLGH